MFLLVIGELKEDCKCDGHCDYSMILHLTHDFITEISCGVPDKNSNSTVTSNSNKFMGIATYQCVDGYQPSGGNQTRTCDSSGNWTGSALECQSKSFDEIITSGLFHERD